MRIDIDRDRIERVLLEVADRCGDTERAGDPGFDACRRLEHAARIVDARVDAGDETRWRQQDPRICAPPDRIGSPDPRVIDRAEVSGRFQQYRWSLVQTRRSILDRVVDGAHGDCGTVGPGNRNAALDRAHVADVKTVGQGPLGLTVVDTAIYCGNIALSRDRNEVDVSNFV